jgi:hypothetical protein
MLVRYPAMPIYGYNRKDSEATEPMVLSEVTFQLGPEDLRRVAGFLIARAEEIEQGRFVDGGRQLSFVDNQWCARDIGDVIVVPPADTEAR